MDDEYWFRYSDFRYAALLDENDLEVFK